MRLPHRTERTAALGAARRGAGASGRGGPEPKPDPNPNPNPDPNPNPKPDPSTNPNPNTNPKPNTTAYVVEVVGSRFLRRFGLDSDSASSKAVHWQLRFPRVSQWAEASVGIVPDTVASFSAKAMVAFACVAAGAEGQRVGEEARDAVAAHGCGAAPARWPALALAYTSEQMQLSQPSQPTLGWAGERAVSEGSQHRTWDETTRHPQAPPRPAAATAAVSLPLLPRPQQARMPPHAPPSQAEKDDWDTEDEGSDELEGMKSQWREEEQRKQEQRKRSRK